MGVEDVKWYRFWCDHQNCGARIDQYGAQSTQISAKAEAMSGAQCHGWSFSGDDTALFLKAYCPSHPQEG